MPRQDVFFSHARADTESARLIVSQVEAHGIECWYAARDVPPGADWPTEIVHALEVAKVMVLIFSVSSNNSPQVRNEVVLANSRNIRVVTFRLADVAPSDGLAYFLGGQQWIDAFPAPLEPHCPTLVACLDRILMRPANPPKPSSRPHPPVKADETSQKKVREPNVAADKPEHQPLTIESSKLRRIETELANYIGPIAKWKVECAVVAHETTDALLISLGDEIDAEKDRAKFMNSCRLICG